MKNKKPYDMHYKKDGTGITVSRLGRFRLRFDGATSARHEKKRYISVGAACSYRHKNPTEFEQLGAVAEIFLQNLD